MIEMVELSHGNIKLNDNKDPVAASFVQVRKCWECGSEDHVKKKCPQWKAKQLKTSKKPAVSAVQLCRGKEPDNPVWIG